jgi:glycerol transport system ATP-binding protein
MAEIRLENVAHSYDGGETFALKETSMVWEDGQAYALLGPSGCGKTTLLNIISGLIIPSHGKIFVDGVDITEKDTEERNIAQVFQFPVLYDTMTVRKNLEFPLKNRKVPREKIESKVEEIAEMLGITEMLDKRPGKLRSDLQQIVSLGRGLVRDNVSAILFDEPLTVIDQNFKWTLRSRLKKLHLQTEATIVYVTHDQTEALTFADQVLVMKDGEIIQSGTSEELYLEPRHEFVGFFIGSPGMNFINVDIQGNEVLIDGKAFGTVSETVESGSYKLGVRPEFVEPHPSGYEMQVERVENRGVYQLAHLNLAGSSLIAKVDSSAELVAGQTSNFSFAKDRSFLFQNERFVANFVPESKVSK